MTYTNELNKNEKRAFAGFGCALVAYILGFLAFWATVIYVVAHFVIKAW